MVLNLYLAICALAQVLSDYVHRPLRGPESALPVRQLPARALTALLSRRLRRKARELQELARTLAVRVLADDRAPGHEDLQWIARLRATWWPADLRRCRLRVPGSFRGADLHPKDCELLADRASRTNAEASTPVIVIALSTSGSYLGPLFAAALDRLGHSDVRMLALRTDRPQPAHAACAVHDVVEREGWAIVVGDSGDEGVGFRKAIVALTELGLPESRISLVTGAASDRDPIAVVTQPDGCGPSAADQGPVSAGLPEASQIFLRQDECHVRRLMSDEAVERWLNRAHVLERLNADAAAVMGGDWVETGRSQSHLRRLFEVVLRRDDQQWHEFVLGRGVGLGFFGYHALLAAMCLGDWVPDALGIHHGVLFLRWEPGEELSGPIEPQDLEELATYVAARARRLALRSRLTSKPEAHAAGEAALKVARLVSQPLEPRGQRARVRVAELIASVPSSRHSIVDGYMGPPEWVRLANRRLLKRDFVARSPEVTDPVHDLAATVIGFRLDMDEERHLVAAYHRLTRDSKDLAARLEVHKLQLGWSELTELPRLGLDLKTRAGRVAFARQLVIRETLLTRTVNSYLAWLYLTGITADAGGQVWVFGFDGSLETDRLGFEATSPAGVLALRLLRAHGQGVFGCTGGSLGELRERCRTFGLLGGVAEHGGVIWDEQGKEALAMIGEEARLSITQLREALLDETDVLVDPRHRYSLCLFRHVDGGRQAAGGDEVRAVMARHGITGLDVIEDGRSTMVCASGAGTAEAFQRLRSKVGLPRSLSPVRVVSHDPGDLDLMRQADGCYAPATAGADFRTRAAGLPVWYASRPYQAGTLQIVRRVLHHWRGRCSACRLFPMPRLDRADAALVMALGLQDRRGWNPLDSFR